MRHYPLIAVAVAVLPARAAAQPAPPLPSAADQRQAEADAAIKDAMAHAQRGPGDIALRDQAHIRLPPHTLWFPAQYARRVLRAWGNTPGDNTLGMLAGATGRHDWTAIVTFTHDGHVKDDDSKSLDANDVLSQLRDNQAEANKDRAARGFPGLELTGWLQPPAYDTAAHRLIWALMVADIGETDTDTTVNYNTRNLGRDGYVSLNMLTSRNYFATDKPIADRLLNGFAYNPGKRYQDFDASTDHVAAYGLAALIGVVALKKLGLLALGAAFALKFAKLGVVAVLAAGAAIKRFFGKRTQPKPGAPGLAA
jgi:uncharacterized membrane-anchored protein